MAKNQQLGLTFGIFLLLFSSIVYANLANKNSSNVIQEELVISFDPVGCGEEDAAAFVMGSVVSFVLSSILLLSTRTSKLFYLFLVTEIITGSFLVSSMVFNKWVKDKETTTLLNEQGIWDQYCGSISWNDIEKVAIVQAPFGAKEVIGITIKEVSLPSVKEKVSQDGRRVMFYDADSYGYHIFFSAMSVPFERILSFAGRFMQ